MSTATAEISEHGNAKFPLVEAYILRRQGKTIQQIADKYGVCKSTVSERFSRHFPQQDVKEFLKIRNDLYRLIEAKNIEELANRPIKKVSDRQLIGNLMGINQILSQEAERTGDININIIQILSKALDHNETVSSVSSNDPVIEPEYHEVKQIDTDGSNK